MLGTLPCVDSLAGGTAGCVLASRLSEDPSVSVLLIERGPALDTWISRIPLASSNIFNPAGGACHWLSEPAKCCNNRRSFFFCAEALGGGSRVNGMVYTRGTRSDYNAWATLGHPDWTYEKLLPYFIKSETALDQPKSRFHGESGTKRA